MMLALAQYMQKPSSILLVAKRIIERRGWVQGWFSDGEKDGACCPLGAINLAATGFTFPSSEKDPKVVSDARVYLRAAIGYQPIAPWNDDKDRTVEDVLTGLEEGRRLALAGGQ